MAGAPTFAGFAYFAGVKAAGYTAASVVLKRGYGLRDSPKPSVWSVGLARTGIGIGVGLLYGGLWLLVLNRFFSDAGVGTGVLYYVLLLPVRLAEWSILISIFFDPGLHDRSRLWKYAAFGTICSYALDAIGVGAAFVLPGGIWVC